MDLGTAIKNARKQKQIKQYAFAEKCGISPTYLSQLENNLKEPTIAKLEIIANKLGMPLPILFFMALDEKDVSPEKQYAYNLLVPSVKSMIQEFFIPENV
ncbi:MAG: helix-turn-helix domain-containing protein [Flavobacteriales bacterium]